MKKFFKWVFIIFVVLIIIGLIFDEDTAEQKTETDSTATTLTSQPVEAATAKQTPDETSNNQAEDPVTASLTGPQNNAVRSAKQYLSFSGFSREGLIHQLSSSYGDGYKVADATIAVDSLNVDWNEQAVRSAKQYLDMSGFSCDGLVEQLSSSAGEKYTVSQAKYGAQQAGACS